MGYITVLFLLAVSFHFCSSDEFCPPSNVISPCGCDGEGINCMKVRSDAELQRIFASIPRPWSFRAVWISTTDVTLLPTNMFQGIKVQSFNIEVNKIRTIQRGAFAGSEHYCYSISVFGNEIIEFPFADLKPFSYLQIFNAGRNKITAIPDNAFSGHQYLSQIIMPENWISYIGPNAFNGLPSLQRLDLMNNRLTVLGPHALAMNNANHMMLMVNLANCSITSISPTAFNNAEINHLNLALNNLQHLEENAFRPLVKRMANANPPGQIELAGNPLSCIGCSYHWIVVDKVIAQSILANFVCRDGRSLQSLNTHNIMCLIP